MARNDPAETAAQAHTAIDLLALDHVALAVADPGAMSAFLCDYVGMRELARSADGVLVGADPRAAKLRLLPAEGPREPAALARLVLRVADLEHAVASLPPGTELEEDGPDLIAFGGPEGLGLGFTLVAGGAIDYDLDHVVLRVADPQETRTALAEVGCVPRGDTLHIVDKSIRLEELPAWSDRPLLAHVAMRVTSVDAMAADARRCGLEIGERLADDRLAIVLPGLERIRLEFVEQGAGQ